MILASFSIVTTVPVAVNALHSFLFILTGGKKREAMNKFTRDFLNECRFWQTDLRKRFVPDDVYVAIDKNLRALGHCDQVNLRSKMKGLKTSFSNAQKGKIGGVQWQHYDVMKHIFLDPIDENGADGADGRSSDSVLNNFFVIYCVPVV